MAMKRRGCWKRDEEQKTQIKAGSGGDESPGGREWKAP